MDMRMHCGRLTLAIDFEKWLVTSSNIFLCVDRGGGMMFTVFEGSEKSVKSS